ncbi:MAG TPA: L,D-transpeptidase family protein [Xanthobacteraceae bacterium]|nr:L,D-transpeptidase family protein [Xanthobacteraceae bacterium]
MPLSFLRVANPMRCVTLAVLTAGLMAAPALAQTGNPPPAKSKAKAQAKTEKSDTKAPKKSLAAAPRISNSPHPTFDEGTARRISAAMLSYSTLEVRGGWPTLPAEVAKLTPGSSGPEVALLRQRLAITDDLAPQYAKGDVFDANVTAAIRRFQSRHGLEETGTIGQRTLTALNVPVSRRLRQLSASMDRISAMDFTFGYRHVVVNIPAAVTEAIENGKVVRRHAAIVGKPDRPSPTLTTSLTAVNLNPTWTVPLSIVKKDIRVKMRRDPGYIARMHMRVLDGNGRELDPGSINWNSDNSPNFTIRQDSGTWNALGAVRFDMPNPHSVYLHDTNNRSLFGSDLRFQSSGCARVENPRDLAVWLLQGQGDWSRAQIDAAIASGQRQDIRLTRKVPVAWIYLTGWVTADNVVHFRDDIYNHDGAPSRAVVADLGARDDLRASGFILQNGQLPARPSAALDNR